MFRIVYNECFLAKNGHGESRPQLPSWSQAGSKEHDVWGPACEAPLEGIYGACTKSVFSPLETPQIAVARIMNKDNM